MSDRPPSPYVSASTCSPGDVLVYRAHAREYLVQCDGPRPSDFGARYRFVILIAPVERHREEGYWEEGYWFDLFPSDHLRTLNEMEVIAWAANV